MPASPSPMRESDRKVLFTVRTTAAMRDRLRLTAEARNQTMSDIVREGLEAVAGVSLAPS